MNTSSRLQAMFHALSDPDDRSAWAMLAMFFAEVDDDLLEEYVDYFSMDASPVLSSRLEILRRGIISRRRGKRIFKILNGTSELPEDILNILLDLHFLWFDKDEEFEVHEDLNKFRDVANSEQWETLDDVEMFMRKMCFLPERETTVRPELYCLGSVLENHCGADSLMALMISGMLKNSFPVEINGEFGTADGRGRVLLGSGAWRQISEPEKGMVVWDKRKLLRYIVLTLFSCAANSDSYRYMMSIAVTLTGDGTKHIFDGFPYPYISDPAAEMKL